MKKRRAKREMVESSDKTWSTGEGNGKPLPYFYLEDPMNSIKKKRNKSLYFSILLLLNKCKFEKGRSNSVA